MKQLGLFALLSMSLLLIGCGIEPALSGKAFDDYQKSIKPYIAYWEKEGMTEEGRLKDWVGCGGRNDGSINFISEKTIRVDSEKIAACMLEQGYRYEGECWTFFGSYVQSLGMPCH